MLHTVNRLKYFSQYRQCNIKDNYQCPSGMFFDVSFFLFCFVFYNAGLYQQKEKKKVLCCASLDKLLTRLSMNSQLTEVYFPSRLCPQNPLPTQQSQPHWCVILCSLSLSYLLNYYQLISAFTSAFLNKFPVLRTRPDAFCLIYSSFTIYEIYSFPSDFFANS